MRSILKAISAARKGSGLRHYFSDESYSLPCSPSTVHIGWTDDHHDDTALPEAFVNGCIIIATAVGHEVVAGSNFEIVGGTSEREDEGFPCPLFVSRAVRDKDMPLLARREGVRC